MCISSTCPNNKSGIGADFMCDCKLGEVTGKKVITIISSKPENTWVAHKGPFIHLGNNVMKCPRCGLEGKGDVFAYISCVIK